MSRKASTNSKKRKKPDEISVIVAEIFGVSVRHVQLVRSGERKNDEILATVIDYQHGKNQLLAIVKKMVPLD